MPGQYDLLVHACMLHSLPRAATYLIVPLKDGLQLAGPGEGVLVELKLLARKHVYVHQEAQPLERVLRAQGNFISQGRSLPRSSVTGS